MSIYYSNASEPINISTIKTDSWDKTSFCTCSYLKSVIDYRASIVRGAMQSWDGLLDLPFAEKIFFDDKSPNFNGLKLLKLCDKINKFTHVRYNTMSHPPHSNFGITMSMMLCQGDYIMHIDDDVKVNGSYKDCFNLIEECFRIMNEDKSILGINLINQDPSRKSSIAWAPGETYLGSDKFAHPNKYFGTAACLIKKELLEIVALTDIINWGSQQPANWEELVSHNVSSFLVTKASTPFIIEPEAWIFKSTAKKSILSKYKYFLTRKLVAVINAIIKR